MRHPRILAAKGSWDGADPLQEIVRPIVVKTPSEAAAV
jgi:hypothetical protein